MILQSSAVSGKQARSVYLLWFLPLRWELTKGKSIQTHQHNSNKIHGLTQGKIQLKQMVSKLHSLFPSKLLHRATGKLFDTAACCIKSEGPTVSSEVSSSKAVLCESLYFLSGLSSTKRKSLSVFCCLWKDEGSFIFLIFLVYFSLVQRSWLHCINKMQSKALLAGVLGIHASISFPVSSSLWSRISDHRGIASLCTGAQLRPQHCCCWWA